MLIKTLHKISMPAGVRLRLTEGQFARRQYVVGRDADGVSLVTTPLEFKAGELVFIDGDVPNVIPAAFYQVEDVAIETELKEHPGTGEVMEAIDVSLSAVGMLEVEPPPVTAKPKAKKTTKAAQAAPLDDTK